MLDMANPFGAAWKNVRRARKVITDHNLKVGRHTHLNPSAHRAVRAFIPSSTSIKDKRAHTFPCRMRNCRERGSSLGGYWWCAPGVAVSCMRTRNKHSAIMRPWPRWGTCQRRCFGGAGTSGFPYLNTVHAHGVHAVDWRWDDIFPIWQFCMILVGVQVLAAAKAAAK